MHISRRHERFIVNSHSYSYKSNWKHFLLCTYALAYPRPMWMEISCCNEIKVSPSMIPWNRLLQHFTHEHLNYLFIINRWIPKKYEIHLKPKNKKHTFINRKLLKRMTWKSLQTQITYERKYESLYIFKFYKQLIQNQTDGDFRVTTSSCTIHTWTYENYKLKKKPIFLRHLICSRTIKL